jgi:recombination DNA repair RAD52 pathway protein
MAFTDNQVRLLKAKLDPRHIRTRSSNGSTLSYVEGWHAVAEANRIFGTISASCVGLRPKAGTYRAVYSAKVRITVRAGDANIIREGSGACETFAATAGQDCFKGSRDRCHQEGAGYLWKSLRSRAL